MLKTRKMKRFDGKRALFAFLCLLGPACSSVEANESKPNPVEQKFIEAGLVDVEGVDSSIKVRLVNSDASDNFFREDFYRGLHRAYLQEPVAQKLARAQKILKRDHPDYSLLIMDAARPRSVSVVMYEKMKGTRFEKYVANPKKGSMHNYGAAVDVTVVDKDGALLDMGFLPFYQSTLGMALSYVFSNKENLSKEQKHNRALLKRVMLAAGFEPLAHEWWHFNGFSKAVVRKRFKMIK